jgi:hypothetical protein
MKKLVLSAIVFGLAVVFTLNASTLLDFDITASAQGNAGNQYIGQAFNSKATDARLALNVLLREHTVMAATMLKSQYNGEDTTQLQKLMDTNQNNLASLVETAYGKNARNSFVTLWSNHMQQYKNYVTAEKNNNTTAMNTARNNLQTISNKLGKLLAGNNLSAATVSSMMMQHANGTLDFVDAVASDNATQQANLMKKGYDQAGKFADTLARGIILDKPNLFK